MLSTFITTIKGLMLPNLLHNSLVADSNFIFGAIA